jgi:hypothetical protein
MVRILSRSVIYMLLLIITAGCQNQQFLPLTAKKAASNPITPTPVEVSITNTSSPTPVKIYPTISPILEQETPTPTGLPRVHLPLQVKSAGKADLKWQLVSRTLQGNKENGRFVMDLRYPEVQGSQDATLENLTGEVQSWINAETEGFLRNTQGATSETWNGFLFSKYSIPSSPSWSSGQNPGNFQAIQPTVLGTESIFDGGHPVVSILFESMAYYGGAHPTEHHTSINYDLETGKSLKFADLFQPGVDYLAAIANFAKVELRQRLGLYPQKIEEGAAPMIDNYTIWNVTPDGLLITFEEYQVGPYAAGTQSVMIPYEILRNLLSKQGPLSNWGN